MSQAVVDGVAGGRRAPATRRWIKPIAVIEAVLLAAAIVAGASILNRLGDTRVELIDHLDPQVTQAQNLTSALHNQQTAISGYLLTGRRDFVSQYQQAKRAQDDTVARLRDLGIRINSGPDRDLANVLGAARDWQQTVEGWTAADPAANVGAVDRERAQFDALQAALGQLRGDLDQARAAARDRLSAAGTMLTVFLAAVAVLFVALYLGFHRTVVRPLTADLDAKRRRSVDEVSELNRAHELLDKRTRELERSNANLEQFAYIASHDLQEPLRKVTSFCQLLQRRYQGRLDERGEQYIGYAVDGAKRMQVLINDLLAFSQVGRDPGEPEVVDTEALLTTAIANLESAIEYSGATVSYGELPKVRGEASLLTAVFQNLTGNALKFRGEDPPQVRVEAVRDGDVWLFSVTDKGIGIEVEHAERVFVIFQRLHTRSAYPGTGIGLAMCRKIIEYHGGRIWLDTNTSDGQTRFCFTLPALTETTEH